MKKVFTQAIALCFAVSLLQSAVAQHVDFLDDYWDNVVVAEDYKGFMDDGGSVYEFDDYLHLEMPPQVFRGLQQFNNISPLAWQSSQQTPGYVVIIIDPTGIPECFDKACVLQHMRTVLQAANIESELYITISDPDLHDGDGFQFDTQSYLWHSPYRGWVTSAIIDTWNWNFRKVTCYQHKIKFDTVNTGLGNIAMTPKKGFSSVYVKSFKEAIQKLKDEGKDPDECIALANILLHEVYWFGVLCSANDPLIQDPENNGLDSKFASTTELLTITPGYAEQIDQQMIDKDIMGSYPQIWVEPIEDEDGDPAHVVPKKTKLGDANLDHQVDFQDFNILSANFESPGGWRSGDFDGSGYVDFADFLILSANYDD